MGVREMALCTCRWPGAWRGGGREHMEVAVRCTSPSHRRCSSRVVLPLARSPPLRLPRAQVLLGQKSRTRQQAGQLSCTDSSSGNGQTLVPTGRSSRDSSRKAGGQSREG